MASSSGSSKLVILILYLLQCSIRIGCLSTDTLSLNQQVFDGQTIVSAGDVFELGFFSPNVSDARYVGIWYKEHGGRIVWVANRENPVMDLSGVLMIGDDGNLIIQDGKKSIIWSTHINATSRNTVAVLSDIGNLVLKENRSNGLEFWDSFGHPSETLVPRMKIGLDGKTDTKIFISSWKNNADPSQGNFTLSVDGQELPQITIWNGSHKHYRTGQWNGRNFIGLRYLNNDYTNGFALVADGVDGTLSFNFASFGNSRPRLIYLNPSGSFELLDWDAGEKEWKEIRAIPNSPCDIYGACGSFGRCNDDEWSIICKCLTGYEPRNMDEWNKEIWKEGCLRRQQFKCQRNTSMNVEEDGFLEYQGTKLPDLALHSYTPDKSSCEALCLKNCSCTAYAYVDSVGCMLWENDLIDIQSYSFGGENLYVRVSHSELGGKGRSKALLGVYVSSAVLGSCLVLYIIYRWTSKQGGCSRGYLNIVTFTNKKISQKDLPARSFRQEGNAEVHIFSLKEMEDATENFTAANKLGEGGFGSVYRGKLSNGQLVAVKRLSRSSGQGIEELKNEVILISKLQHRNLVNLDGLCIQEEEKLLVYEYMSNRSLDKFIFGSNSKTIVDWNMRYNIIEGIARGILYLHRDSRLKIIHRDLKTSNILLDEEMTPKISDFGMARIFGGKQATANTNRVVGTYGYMSPEYAMHGIFSEKSDVFSFGMVLLEIVTGLRNTGFRYHSDAVHLPSHVWKFWSKGKAMGLLDPRLVESCNLSQVLKCIQVGLLCVQDYETDRPTMATIVAMLSGDFILPIPEQPVFSIKPKISLDERDPSIQEWPTFSRNSISETSIVGDPLEKAALSGIDWSYKSDEKALPKRGSGDAVQIVQRHHFASHLKRMAVVVRVQEQFFAFVKGAPETIQERIVDVPPFYMKTYKRYTRQGSRVLALAYKSLPEMTVSEARSLDRDIVESGLTFAGFAVFTCPIRGDSATVLSELKLSSHDLVMITGDQALTACHVAAQVHIVSKPALILGRANNTAGFEWVSPDEAEIISYREDEVEMLAETHDLCVGGDCIEMLQQTSSILKVIPFVKVFARVAPEQKELILTTFKSVGRITLMCGDGTNDVGALKQAHIGIALLNAVPPGKSEKSSSDASSKNETTKSARAKKVKQIAENGEGSSKSTTSKSGTGGQVPNRHLTAAEAQRQKLKKLMDELNDEGDGRAPIVKLGDASMASPFTAKHASVAPTTDVIRQGRSTLVTTLQMFKILGLNCLATAYVLSVMYLDGVKLGDVQATISGVFTAAFFLFISHARPLPTLSAERPHPNIFCYYVFLSLMGQFSVHILFLITSVKEAEKYMPDECIEPDSDFHPNLVNTVSYMVNMMLQVATFAVNYMGHPFNQSITENKPFLYALIASVGFFTAITSDIFRDLNDWLKLVPLPKPLRNKLLLWAFGTFLICYTWEKLLRWAFPGKMPAWKERQRQVATRVEKNKQV